MEEQKVGDPEFQRRQEQREAFWRERIKEGIEDLQELIELDFFGVGNRYGAEQFLSNPEDWDIMDEEERQGFLRALESCLAVGLLDFSEDQVIRRYKAEGVPGTRSEGGADVAVLPTKFPRLEVHVMDYKNPQLGTRYDLVRGE